VNPPSALPNGRVWPINLIQQSRQRPAAGIRIGRNQEHHKTHVGAAAPEGSTLGLGPVAITRTRHSNGILERLTVVWHTLETLSRRTPLTPPS